MNCSEKQRQLERIKDKLSEQLARMKSDEDERLASAVSEAEAKFAQEEHVKKERSTRLLHEMDQFRKVRYTTSFDVEPLMVNYLYGYVQL